MDTLLKMDKLNKNNADLIGMIATVQKEVMAKDRNLEDYKAKL